MDGDMIEYDIPRRRLRICLTKSEIEKRMKKWKPPEPKIDGGFLGVYRQIVGDASGGARLGGPDSTRRRSK
jgi:dihydroxy-acid dehydratase